MLYETIAVIVLILPVSLVATWSLRSDVSRSWQLGVMIIGPVGDAWLTWLLMCWLEMGFVATWTSVISIGLISMMFIQPIFSPRRLLVFRLASQQIRRKPRQAALMMAGLLVASSIITSSLVVGDSLDETMQSEIDSVWADTDLYIFSIDRRTGITNNLDQNLTTSFGQSLSEDNLADGWMHGIESTSTLSRADGLAIPSVSWFAYDDWTGVSINQVAADELELNANDEIEVTWFTSSSTGKLIRNYRNLTITEVIPMEGIGSMGGSRSPSLFTSLELAQEMQEMEWKVNRLRVSLEEGLVASQTIPEVESTFDEMILAEDSSFEVNMDGDAISISYDSGLGRIDESVMTSWRENHTSLLDGGTAMEVLQIPIIQIEQGQSILSLPDDRIERILIAEDGDWYVSAGGVSFQIDRGGDSHLWEVPDGGLIYDIELNNGSMMIAHSNGLTEVFEDPDEDVIHHIKGEEVRLATTPSNGQYELPSTVFSLDHIDSDGDEWLAIKGLLGSEVLHLENDEWVSTNISAEWLLSDDEGVLFGSPSGWQTSDGLSSPEGWTGLREGFLLDESGTLHRFSSDGTELIAEPASDCDGRVFADDGFQLCSTTYGVLIETETGDQPRLPLTVDLGGIGILPQLLLATNTSLSPDMGQILIADRLSSLDQNESVLFNGLIPYAYGDDTPEILTINGSMSSINAPGLDELETIIIGLVNLSDGEKLASASEGERSMLIINGGNETAILAWLDDVAGTKTMDLRIKAAKEEASQSAEEGAGVLSAMFLVFGTFTIGAGILLVLTIVIMLAEQRRVDEATVRALGLKRSDMRSMALMEGVMTSSMASILGGIFGIFLAWLISLAFSSVFASAGADSLEFSFGLESMLIGMSCGFLIAIFTLWMTALWTSKHNIVQALRGINPSRQRGVPWWMMLLIIVLIGSGSLSGLSLLVLSSDSLLFLPLWHITASLLLMGIIPIFTFVLPHMMKWSVRNTGRNTMSVLGIALFVWALIPDSLDPVRSGREPDEITFAILGLVEVFAGVMVLSGLAPRLASWFGRRKFMTKRFGPLVNVSLAHPGAAPLRTAVVMGMFSLTVFSVVVLAGYSVQFESHSSGYVEDASGDFEILLTSSRQAPINLSEDPFEWGLENTTANDIDAVGIVSRAVVWVEKGNDSTGYVLRGVDDGFINHGGLPLEEWDSSLGATQEEAWAAMKENQNIVFIDSSFALIDPNTGEAMSGMTILLGDVITLTDISNPGNSKEMQVGGIMSQSSNLFSTGIWLNGEVVEEQFGGVVTRIYVSHNEDVQSEALEEKLSKDLAKQGVSTSVIEENILVLLGLIFAILSIFQSYLALGLVVGIAGIGVVTYRSVSERSGQIGMLRALGFRRRMVKFGMILEISWVSLLGMLNGALVALAFHTAIHNTIWQEQGVELILPWTTIIWLIIGGWIMVLLATTIPVSRATKITPSESLSSIE